MNNTYLLEIGLEEVPAQMILPATAQLEQAARNFLKQHGLPEAPLRTFSTPRRLALEVTGLPDQQPDRTLEVKGPPANIARTPEGDWSKAAIGFAKKNRATPDQLEVREVEGKDYVFVVREESGRPVPELLQESVAQWIHNLSFPKNMRWGHYRMRLIRPIRWLLSLWNQEVIPIELEMVSAGSTTRGHRFLGAREVVVSTAQDYEAVLEQQFVMANFEKRQATITEQIRALEAQHGFRVRLEADLLEEVTNLVEWPTALVGNFESEFLEVPAEVLVTSMATHQRYFPVYDAAEERLLAHFVTVRNGDTRALETVRHGNEKVLRARLSDARFFYLEDRKRDFAYFATKADQGVFFQKRGTQGQRVARLQALSASISELLEAPPEQAAQTQRIAELCKFDLFTQMVYEFPELQGYMGEDYARLLGEDPVVCQGIREHYFPRNAEDALPEHAATLPVALADRLDQLAVAFSLGMIPTGSADPYALRRAAQGVVQLLLGLRINLPLTPLLEAAIRTLDEQQQLGLDRPRLLEELQAFLAQRLRWYFQEQAIRHDVTASVLAAPATPLEALDLAQGLAPHLESQPFKKAMEAIGRCQNIAAKNPLPEDAQLRPDAFESAEQAFHEAVRELPSARETPEVFLAQLLRLEAPITEFFDAVLVMDPEEAKRTNRLKLCALVSAWVQAYLDPRELVLPA